MKHKKIVEHSFCTDEELISKLINKGLRISDKSKLLRYLQSFNYQNVINGYKKPFLINDYYKQYLHGATSQMIIDFFNFNRTISNLLIGDLHAIEMKFSTAISIELMKIIRLSHPTRTAFNALSIEEKKKIFKWKNPERMREISDELQNNFNILKSNKEFIDDSWTSWEEVPLYSLSLLWTFGLAIKLFTYLDDEIKKNVLNKHFWSLKDLSINTLISLLNCFKDLRNKISHNEPIYQYKFDVDSLSHKISLIDVEMKQQVIRKMIKNDISIFSNKNFSWKNNFKLFWIAKMLALINNNQKIGNLFKEKTLRLKSQIYTQVEDSKASTNSNCGCNEIWKNICNFLGFKDD